jgi:hypothetical protein
LHAEWSFRMEEKLRVYIVSVMAFSALNDTTVEGESTFVEHLPAIVPAASIEDAAENACAFAMERWKAVEGWYGHQAAIQPVTQTFYEAAFNAFDADVVELGNEGKDEPGQVFQF